VIRRVIVGLLGVTFLLAGLAIAQEQGGDEPPVRLKKKVRPDEGEKVKEEQPKPAEPPKEEGPKAKPKEGDPPAQPDQPEEDESEVLNRVSKNMRTSEDHLANRELTDATRQVQEDILKDLDALINKTQNGGDDNQDQQNQDKNQGQQDQPQGGQQKKSNGQTKIGMGGGRKRLRGEQQARGQGRKSGGQPKGQGQGEQMANAKPGVGQGQQPMGQGGGAQPGGGGQSGGEANKLAEIYKDKWGELPETMRAQMNAYSREQFMAKYNDLTKQYYSAVAEKSRKRD
jgi:hypothetical protein